MQTEYQKDKKVQQNIDCFSNRCSTNVKIYVLQILHYILRFTQKDLFSQLESENTDTTHSFLRLVTSLVYL